MAIENKFCSVVYFVTGITNVLLIKWISTLKSEGSDGVLRNFEHPFMQTGVMFLAQILCYLVFKILFSLFLYQGYGNEIVHPLTEGGRDFSLTIFIVPAVCDLLSTVMLLYGFYFTYVTSAQILRCTAIIFASLYSLSFLDPDLHQINTKRRVGMLTILLGTILVCIADSQKDNWKTALTGDLLVMCSQVFHSLQLVYEEKYISVYNLPALQAAGWEGLFGFCILLIILVPLNFINICAPFGLNAHKVLEDIPDAYYQLYNNHWLVIGHILFILSVFLYNFCGMRITASFSSYRYMKRIVLNCLGIFFISAISLGLSWESFSGLQIFGYIVVICGVFIYKKMVFQPCCRGIILAFAPPVDDSDSSEDEVVSNQTADSI